MENYKKSIPSLIYLLYESINEIKLSADNAAKIEGNHFTIGKITYKFYFQKININGKEYPDIAFDQVGNLTSNSRLSNTERGEIFKVYSTMYKIILDFLEKEKPEKFTLSSAENSGYHTVYSKLFKENQVPNYFIANRSFKFENNKGQKFIATLFKRY